MPFRIRQAGVSTALVALIRIAGCGGKRVEQGVAQNVTSWSSSAANAVPGIDEVHAARVHENLVRREERRAGAGIIVLDLRRAATRSGIWAGRFSYLRGKTYSPEGFLSLRAFTFPLSTTNSQT
jgi:hypothetical protein